jgi:SAM-dependent methyltransferase
MRSINVCLPHARRVLDIGCGVGWVLAEAPTQGSPLRFGVDYSVNALRGVAGGPQLRTDRQNPRIDFVAGDGARLPFIDEAFDVVIGHVSMPYMNTRRAFREVYRVLAPGGECTPDVSLVLLRSPMAVERSAAASLQRGHPLRLYSGERFAKPFFITSIANVVESKRFRIGQHAGRGLQNGSKPGVFHGLD